MEGMNPIIKKSTKRIIIAIVLALVLIVAVFFALNNKQAEQPIQDTANETKPFTLKPLTPVLEIDRPSPLYQNSITAIQPNKISAEAEKRIKNIINKFDPEIASRNVGDLNRLSSIFYVNDSDNFVLYMMTPTGTSCIPPGDIDSGCSDVELKVLDMKDDTVSPLTKHFNGGAGSIYLNSKDDSLIVFADSHYEIFSLNKPYALLKFTPNGFLSLLFNEYAVSYNSTTDNLTIEDILDNRKIDCTVTRSEAENVLKNNFDFRHLSLSPNGNKLVLAKGNNTFLWDELSEQWTPRSSSCLNNAKEITLSATGIVAGMGKWYGNSSYFAYSDYGANTIIYNFDVQKQILFMSWDGAVGAGFLNNSGYHDTARMNETSSLITVPQEKQISIFLESPDKKRYLVGSYSDTSSTQAFYNLTQQYPVNSAGDYTSGKLVYAGVPRVWTLIGKDTVENGLYHLLVLDGYNLKQAIDVLVQP